MPNLLVVDNERPQLEMLVAALQASGYDCRGAANAQDAVECLEVFDFCLVLLDPTIPETQATETETRPDHGVKVWRKVRELNGSRGRKTKVVWITGTLDVVHRDAYCALEDVLTLFWKKDQVWDSETGGIRNDFLDRIKGLVKQAGGP